MRSMAEIQKRCLQRLMFYFVCSSAACTLIESRCSPSSYRPNNKAMGLVLYFFNGSITRGGPSEMPVSKTAFHVPSGCFIQTVVYVPFCMVMTPSLFNL